MNAAATENALMGGISIEKEREACKFALRCFTFVSL